MTGMTHYGANVVLQWWLIGGLSVIVTSAVFGLMAIACVGR